MMRLVRKGLMYGNLFEVRGAAMVERYNRALERLTGKRTALTEFHIDMSGYAPEIGEEFGDRLYLNPDGCNRQFILLSPDQKTAPLLNAHFSTSRAILRRFIEENEAQIFALTAQDTIAGEMLNSIWGLRSPAQLFDIRRITIEADTTSAHLQHAGALTEKITRFQTVPDAWWDDVLIAEMIELAGKTGDITRTPLKFTATEFEKGDFHTGHFGGLYIFRDQPAPAAILVDPDKVTDPLPIDTILPLTDRNGIARFLMQNNLVETIVEGKNLDAAALLNQRLDFIIVATAAEQGEDLTGVTRRTLRQMQRRHLDHLPEEFHALADLLRWVEQGGRWPTIAADHPAFFYTLRSKPHENRDLVNMLLAELSPLDVRQLFICHKQRFYEAYQKWDDDQRDYVSDFLATEYAVDKAGTRAALFGPEPGMEEPQPVEGPWGAIPVKKETI